MNNQMPILDTQARIELIALCRKSLLSGTNLDKIQDKISTQFMKLKIAQNYEKQKEQKRPGLVKSRLPAWMRLGAFLLPMTLLVSGFYLLSLAVGPILGYYLDDSKNAPDTNLMSPLPKQYMMDLTPLIVSTSKVDQPLNAEPEIIELKLDYTNLANWFIDAQIPQLNHSLAKLDTTITEYRLDIPSIKLANAVVKVGGSDLNKSLIAFAGTALPGEYGAPVIFGHSVLRKFYNPNEKNPSRYNSIFSYIMTLEPGKDTIILTVGEKKYIYLVQEKIEVKPEDVYILTQQYDAKRLKLVTCVPEGTFLRRGVVVAQLLEESL